MGCLSNLIGLSNCQGQTPSKSGLYLDMLPFLSLETVSGIVTSSYHNAQDLIEAQLDLIAVQLGEEIKRLFFKLGYAMPSLPSKWCEVGFYEPNLALAPWGANDGVTLSFPSNASPFSRLYLKSVGFKSDTSGTVTLQVLDRLGTVLMQKDFNVDANLYNELPLGLDFQSDFLQIKVLAMGHNVYPATLRQASTCAKQCRKPCGKCAKIQACSKPNPSLTGGLTIVYGLVCKIESLVCAVADKMAYAILCKLGANLLDYATLNPRINAFAGSVSELVGEKCLEWKQHFKDSISVNLPQIMVNLLSQKGSCFECQKGYSSQILSRV